MYWCSLDDLFVLLVFMSTRFDIKMLNAKTLLK